MSYSYKAKAVVKVPLENDVSTVRLDKKTMGYLGVKEGDKVEVTASFWAVRGTYTVGKVNELPGDDEGAGIVRLSKDLLKEGNFRPGDKVIVSKA